MSTYKYFIFCISRSRILPYYIVNTIVDMQNEKDFYGHHNVFEY